MAIEPIDLREIDKIAANVYEGVIVAAKRARQINNETKIEYSALVGTIPTSATEDENEDIENPAQLKISLEFEKREKPHIQALNELLESKVPYKYKE